MIEINNDRFYELSELVLMDIPDELIRKCPIVTQSGQRYIWGLDLLSVSGNEAAQIELNKITKKSKGGFNANSI